jgi:glycerol-3-phosphate dehydrogenase
VQTPGGADAARRAALARLRSAAGPWDVLVVGGGATGLATALDAAERGLRTLLLEAGDFASRAVYWLALPSSAPLVWLCP